MKLLRHALVALLANLILLFLALEFNSSLAPLAIYLIVGGIFTVYPAFQLKLIAGLPVVLLTGAIWDAATPGTFGLHMFALGAIFMILHRLRHRFRSRRTFHLAVVSCEANLVLIVILGLWYIPGTALATYGLRFALETLLSEVVVFLLSYWFFDLQEKCVDFLGARPTPEEIS